MGGELHGKEKGRSVRNEVSIADRIKNREIRERYGNRKSLLKRLEAWKGWMKNDSLKEG